MKDWEDEEDRDLTETNATVPSELKERYLRVMAEFEILQMELRRYRLAAINAEPKPEVSFAEGNYHVSYSWVNAETGQPVG